MSVKLAHNDNGHKTQNTESSITIMDRTPQRSNSSAILGSSPPPSPWTADRVDAVLRSYGLLSGVSKSPTRTRRTSPRRVECEESNIPSSYQKHSQQRLDFYEKEVDIEGVALRDVSPVPTTPTSIISNPGSGSMFNSFSRSKNKSNNNNTNKSGSECSISSYNESASRMTNTTAASSKSIRNEDITDMFRAVQNWQIQAPETVKRTTSSTLQRNIREKTLSSKNCFVSPFSATYLGVFRDNDKNQDDATQTPITSPKDGDSVAVTHHSPSSTCIIQSDDSGQTTLESYLLSQSLEEYKSELSSAGIEADALLRKDAEYSNPTQSKQQLKTLQISDYAERIKELEMKLNAEIQDKNSLSESYELLKQKYATAKALLQATKQSLVESESRSNSLYMELEKLASFQKCRNSKSLTNEFNEEMSFS